MAATDLPSPSELHKYLSYDPETGELRWKARTPEMFEDGGHTKEHNCAAWNARHAGRQALTSASSNGYRHGAMCGKTLTAHRVAYAIMTGEWPPEQIDHINGVRDDNRWANLRAVNSAENKRNMQRSSRSSSGVTGVYWDKRRSVWHAHVTLNRRRRFLGYFDTIEDAAAARQRANLELGFTQRHGLAA